MITANRQYHLPRKDHVVLEDLEKLCVTFSTIDDDVLKTEEKIAETVGIVDDLEARAVHMPCEVENSEIRGIGPNRYIITTADGSGFECVEGGGDKGGKTGQCSIKKSDENHDTVWGNLLEVSTKGMTVQQNSETPSSNQTHIYVRRGN